MSKSKSAPGKYHPKRCFLKARLRRNRPKQRLRACGAGLCITKCLFCFVQRFHSCSLIHVRKIVRPPGRQTLATTWRKKGVRCPAKIRTLSKPIPSPFFFHSVRRFAAAAARPPAHLRRNDPKLGEIHCFPVSASESTIQCHVACISCLERDETRMRQIVTPAPAPRAPGRSRVDERCATVEMAVIIEFGWGLHMLAPNNCSAATQLFLAIPSGACWSCARFLRIMPHLDSMPGYIRIRLKIRQSPI
ncbi:hypothetical protein B0H14DRAFT_215080 [Mycena olivaceomarginata]|nr:hypothetical protein B0H14DRAFT_215080 [Mycena olivaceomarginata]